MMSVASYDRLDYVAYVRSHAKNADRGAPFNAPRCSQAPCNMESNLLTNIARRHRRRSRRSRGSRRSPPLDSDARPLGSG